jgi:hypothetical protein
MSVDIVTVGFCPQYHARFEVGSSRCKNCGGGVAYVPGVGWRHGKRQAILCKTRDDGSVAEPDEWYEVTLNGAEGAPHCTCHAFKYSGGYGEQDCKHVRLVWERGCLFNPQWKDAGPNDLEQHGARLVDMDTRFVIHGDPCPGCGQDMIATRIAV